MIILDTNVVAEPIKPTPSPAVMAWTASHAADLMVTSITIGELLVGVALLPDGARKRHLMDAVETAILGLPSALPYDSQAARAYADIRGIARRIGRGLSVEDGMIAAICVAQGATLATRNVVDFNFLPIDLVNPWEIT